MSHRVQIFPCQKKLPNSNSVKKLDQNDPKSEREKKRQKPFLRRKFWVFSTYLFWNVLFSNHYKNVSRGLGIVIDISNNLPWCLLSKSFRFNTFGQKLRHVCSKMSASQYYLVSKGRSTILLDQYRWNTPFFARTFFFKMLQKSFLRS